VEFAIAGKNAVMPAIRWLSATRPTAGTSSRRLSEVATGRSSCLPSSSVLMASASLRRPAAIWRPLLLARPFRHLKMVYPTI
jgi:hypothetical protein